jgi:hypothetical protein
MHTATMLQVGSTPFATARSWWKLLRDFSQLQTYPHGPKVGRMYLTYRITVDEHLAAVAKEVAGGKGGIWHTCVGVFPRVGLVCELLRKLLYKFSNHCTVPKNHIAFVLVGIVFYNRLCWAKFLFWQSGCVFYLAFYFLFFHRKTALPSIRPAKIFV